MVVYSKLHQILTDF